MRCTKAPAGTWRSKVSEATRSIGFIKAIRAERKGLPLYALSVMGSAATLAALGKDAYGIAVTQVVPLPTNTVVPVVRDFQQAWRDSGATADPTGWSRCRSPRPTARCPR
jgi:ABC-type branched-subunit amino acid transport system substrate-binding protein